MNSSLLTLAVAAFENLLALLVTEHLRRFPGTLESEEKAFSLADLQGVPRLCLSLVAKRRSKFLIFRNTCASAGSSVAVDARTPAQCLASAGRRSDSEHHWSRRNLHCCRGGRHPAFRACIVHRVVGHGARRLGSEGDGRWIRRRVTALRSCSGGSATLKTMNRDSTATLLISSVVTGLVVVGLTALTQVGAGGAYGFLFLGLLALGIFLLWPDLRSRFFKGRRGVRPNSSS